MILWVDQNLPPALAVWLFEQGHEATHVRDLSLAEASDVDIANRAIAARAVILTKDDDFAFDGPPSSVIVRLGNVTTSRLIDAFERLAKHQGGAGSRRNTC